MGIKAWMGLCWPLGPVVVVTGNHITISVWIWEGEGTHFCVLQIVRNTYIPVARLSSLAQLLKDSSMPQGAIWYVRHCQPPGSLQEWESEGENTQMILGRCTVPFVRRKGGKMPTASGGVCLWESHSWSCDGDCFSSGCMSKTLVKKLKV